MIQLFAAEKNGLRRSIYEYLGAHGWVWNVEDELIAE